MAKQETVEKKEQMTGLLACELFNLNPRTRYWMEKSSQTVKSRTKEGWEKFFKENKVI